MAISTPQNMTAMLTNNPLTLPVTVDIPTCGPVHIPNSTVSSDSDEYPRGTVVHVTCNHGFHHVGTESVTCQASRDWSHGSIVDTARTCQKSGEIK